MLVVGLTGGIGMGKSAAAERLAEHGIPVFDADACVHRLYEGVAADRIEAAFPGATRKGRVDRALLSERIAGSPERLRQLEQIVHPLVIEAELDFLREEEAKGSRLAVLEIPLLFETGAEARVDVTVAVSAPQDVQRGRVLVRPGMTVTPERDPATVAALPAESTTTGTRGLPRSSARTTAGEAAPYP